MLGKARTGSGKTLGFGLPAIARLAQTGRAEPGRPRAIVLVPTRELAMQVNDALEPFAHAMDVSLRLVAGGLSMSKQVRSLERGVHLVVATPGRLADLARRGHADLSQTDLVVLDEADHMADMGFMEEIEEILGMTPAGGQRLLFSATLDGDVDRLVSAHMDDPVLHDVTDGDDAPADMRHVVLSVPPHLKYQLATRIVAREGRTIAFVRSKLACDRIAAEMRDAGVLAVALHGDRSQHERNHAITGFRAGQIPVLVATDVAARGIHVDHVDLVLQMDPPGNHKDYTHRAGRTARAGESGLVVTMSLPHQRKTVDRLIELAGVDATFRKVRGDDAESLDQLEHLTGAREPSGIPVEEPLPSGTGERGRGRGGAGGRGAPRGRGAAGGRDRSGARADRSARPARGDAARRPAHGRTSYGTGASAQHESAKARSDLESRERRLAERERELALREEHLADREKSSRSPRRDSPRRDGDRRDGDRREGTRRDRPDQRRDGRRDRDDDRRDRKQQRDSGGSRSGTGERSGRRTDRTNPASPGRGASGGRSGVKGPGGQGTDGKAAAPASGKGKKSSGKASKGAKSGSSRRGKPRPKKKR